MAVFILIMEYSGRSSQYDVTSSLEVVAKDFVTVAFIVQVKGAEFPLSYCSRTIKYIYIMFSGLITYSISKLYAATLMISMHSL